MIKNILYKALQSKILVLPIIMFVLFLPMISAFEFDNIKNYDSANSLITIKNSILGIPFLQLDKVAEYKLTENTYYCLTDCYTEGIAIFYTNGYLFEKLIFKGRDGSEKILSDSKILIENNGEWIAYKNQELKEGTYRWRIEGKKLPTENVDWIGTAFGIDLDEWIWWSGDWGSKKQINVTGATSNITDFPVYLQIDYDSDMQTDYDDLRFVNSSENQELYFDTDWSNSSGVGIWVNIPKLTNANEPNTTIYMYYGNAGASKVADNYKDNTWGNNATAVYHMLTNITGNDSSISHNNLTMDAGISLNITPIKGFGNQIHIPGDGGTGFKADSIKSSFGVSGSSPYTIVMRFNMNSTADAGHLYQLGNDVAGDGDGLDFSITAVPQWRVAGVTGAGNFGVANTQPHWTIMTYDGSTLNLYLDGDKDFTTGAGTTKLLNQTIRLGGDHDNNQYSDVIIDEFWIFNETKSSEWLNRTLHLNNSNFYIFGDEQILQTTLSVTLKTPINDTNFTGSSKTFTSNSSIVLGNLTNATLRVWNSSGYLIGSNFSVINGTTNLTTMSISGLPIGDYHLWNQYTCGSNISGNICSNAPENFTFSIKKYLIQSESYNTETIEGNTEVFQINISTTDLQPTLTNLVYNHTNYSGIITNLGNFNYSLSRTLSAQDVVNPINISFYWNIYLSDGSQFNSTLHNQTTLPLSIDNCTSNTFLILNYTLKDEKNQNYLEGIGLNASLEVDTGIYVLSSSTAFLNFNRSYYELNRTNTALVCLGSQLNGTTYKLYSTAKYWANGYATEYHNIQNYSLTNNTLLQNIVLYDLNSTDGIPFLITFKDDTFSIVQSALVNILRQYVSEGVFKSVEIPKTDSSGQTIGNFVRDEILYNIIVSKEGKILATFNNVVAVCQDPTISNCIINLNSLSSGTNPTDFETIGGLNYHILFNQSTRTITTTFSTIDGSTSTIRVNSTLLTAYQNTSICTDILTSSSGILSCVIPESAGNVSVIMELLKDNEPIAIKLISISENSQDIFGTSGIIMMLIIIISLPLMFITSTIGMIVIFIVGFIAAGVLNIYTGGSIVGVGSTILWLIIAGAIIIWKIAKEGE